jgi:hypothetical protein
MNPIDIPTRLNWYLRVTIEALRLRILGFNRSVRPLLSGDGDLSTARSVDLGVLANASMSTGRLPWSTCLTRSSALARHLRHLGVPALVRIGVQLPEDGLTAHAWVEVAGQPISEAEESHAHMTPLNCP